MFATVSKHAKANLRALRCASLLACFAAVLFLAMGALAAFPAAAWANNDGTDYEYRVSDHTGDIPSDDVEKLSDAVKAEIPRLKFDFAVYLTDDDAKTAKSVYEEADDDFSFGYGKKNDGIIVLARPEAGTCEVYVSGLGKTIFSKKERAALEKRFVSDMKANPYYASYDFFQKAITDVADYRDVFPVGAWEKGVGLDGEAIDLRSADELDWFPSNPKKFKDFHAEASAPRVIDYANLLTDEEEAQLEAKIADMQKRLGIDFVFYSDNSSYGEERGVYAADFYQFNGYGFGDDYSGVIYFVCMEKGNRGFWTAARGGARELMTEDNVNHMDDRTIDLFKDGDYGQAVLKQFDLLDTLYTNNGFPIEPWVYVLAAIGGVIGGIVGGASNLSAKRKKMKTVVPATSARLYADSPNFTVKSDVITGVTVNRVRHVSESSGGGGGGGSSYSSGYSSSGGGSFSGGGRSF